MAEWQKNLDFMYDLPKAAGSKQEGDTETKVRKYFEDLQNDLVKRKERDREEHRKPAKGANEGPDSVAAAESSCDVCGAPAALWDIDRTQGELMFRGHA
jgi:hypothetical protein